MNLSTGFIKAQDDDEFTAAPSSHPAGRYHLPTLREAAGRFVQEAVVWSGKH